MGRDAAKQTAYASVMQIMQGPCAARVRMDTKALNVRIHATGRQHAVDTVGAVGMDTAAASMYGLETTAQNAFLDILDRTAMCFASVRKHVMIKGPALEKVSAVVRATLTVCTAICVHQSGMGTTVIPFAIYPLAVRTVVALQMERASALKDSLV